jgi:hypothetical protein
MQLSSMKAEKAGATGRECRGVIVSDYVLKQENIIMGLLRGEVLDGWGGGVRGWPYS